MKDELLDTEEKRQRAIGSLYRLFESDDWKVVAGVLDANIEVLTEQIINGEGTKQKIDLLRERLRVYKNVRNTPSHLLENLAGKHSDPPVEDPFSTAEDLEKEKA